MAISPPYQSTGITISMTSTTFEREILDVTPPGRSVEDIPTSHQGTTGDATYEPAVIAEGNELEFVVHMEPDDEVPVGVEDTFTIDYPSSAGGAEWSFEGYINNEDPDAPFRDKLTSTITVKVTGNDTKTAST